MRMDDEARGAFSMVLFGCLAQEDSCVPRGDCKARQPRSHLKKCFLDHALIKEGHFMDKVEQQEPRIACTSSRRGGAWARGCECGVDSPIAVVVGREWSNLQNLSSLLNLSSGDLSSKKVR